MKTIFERIIDKEIPADVVYENDKVIAIRDIEPKAPVHVLIIPKKHFPNLQSVPPEDFPLICECIRVAQLVAFEEGVDKDYRFLTNNGEEAGQTVFHLHFHLLGGRVLGVMG